MLTNPPSNFCRRDYTDKRVLLVHFDWVVLGEVWMRKKLVIVVALAAENYTLHLIDDSLALVPPVQAFNQVTAHYEVETVRLPILLR